jgi:hypothetical protein
MRSESDCMSSPIFDATSPETPVSISSKMIDGRFIFLPTIDLTASISREISPPDAVSPTGSIC